jgi:hypothetical protein
VLKYVAVAFMSLFAFPLGTANAQCSYAYAAPCGGANVVYYATPVLATSPLLSGYSSTYSDCNVGCNVGYDYPSPYLHTTYYRPSYAYGYGYIRPTYYRPRYYGYYRPYRVYGYGYYRPRYTYGYGYYRPYRRVFFGGF